MGEGHTGRPDEGNDRAATERPTVHVRRRLTVSEAADELGISAEAVRSRVKRGTLRSTKEGGTVYVLLAAPVDTDQTKTERDQATARTTPEHDQASDQTEARPDPREELVESLLDQVAYMREQLAEEREARRRADTIIAQLTQANAVLAGRVPEIEPPPRDVPETASEGTGEGEVHPEHQEPVERRSWWRRLLSG